MKNTQQTSLAEVLLSDIDVSETNKMFRSEDDFKFESLQELIASIKENGLAQPILLRPGTKPGRYTLVAGERRFHACKFIQDEIKARNKIPAYIRALSDEQAFDMQITENVERKDTHPMREALAYKLLQDKHKWTTAELALRFGKGETYILQRIKLNSLIPEAQKDFNANAMSLSHALVIARLTPAAQEGVINDCKSVGQDKKVYYSTVRDMEEYIQNNIIHDLKEASFDTASVNLVPKVGSCVTCAKRSGANPLLFSDIKDKDRCFDGACYAMKKSESILLTVRELIEEKPDTIFLVDKYDARQNKILPGITKLFQDNKITPVTDYAGYGYGDMKKKVKGFRVNGMNAGKFIDVYVKGGSATTKKGSTSEVEEDVQELIERIKERTKRAAELDQEKIYSKVIEELATNKKWNESNVNVSTAEEALIAMMVYNHADFRVREEINQVLKLGRDGKNEAARVVNIFKEVTTYQLAWMSRKMLIQQYSSPYHYKTSEGILTMELAKSFGVPVDEIIKEQEDIRSKREVKAKERIADLTAKAKTEKKAKKKVKEAA